MNKHQKYRASNVAKGLCPHCGRPTSTNPKTGKPYHECGDRRKNKSKSVKKRVEILTDGYIRNNLNLVISDKVDSTLINLKREHLRLFRISRGGKRYEKYV